MRRAKVSVSLIISFKTMLFLHSNSHTSIFDVLIPFEFHRIIMSKQVTRTSIHRTVDLVRNVEFVGEPHSILKNSFYIVISFIFFNLG